MQTPSCKLCIECLEDRNVLSGFHVPWADGSHLTLSFAPDGTNVQGQASALFQELQSIGSTNDWQQEITRAFQTWAAHANLNIGIVADQGQPLGTNGAVQGDTRFGDIRIAAKPMSNGLLATASPFSWTGTTWSGDIILNTNYPFSIGQASGKFDLFSVFLHEAGHVFGLDHTTDHDATMFETYSYRTSLSTEDIVHLQELYGPRVNDEYEAGSVNGNSNFSNAASLGLISLSSSLNGVIANQNDTDYYSFTALPTLGVTALTVQLKTSGISQLLSRVSIYDSSYRLVASQAAVDPLDGDLVISIGGVRLFNKYFVKVESNTTDVFSSGSYHLKVGYGLSLTSGLLAPLHNIVNDLHVNDVLSAATQLLAQPGDAGDDRFDYTYQASIRDSYDTDYYYIQAPASAASKTMVALVWGLGSTELNPELRVYNADGDSVPFQILANSNSHFSLQIEQPVPQQTYYFKVFAKDPDGSTNTGSYFLGIDFSSADPLVLDQIGSNTLTSTANVDTASFLIAHDKLMHFSLAASSLGQAEVTMTVFDSAGRAVLEITARANQPNVTSTLYLKTGQYSVRYAGRSLSNGPLANVSYALSLIDLSGIIGTYATSTSSSGGGTGSETGGGYTYTGASNKPSSSYQAWR